MKVNYIQTHKDLPTSLKFPRLGIILVGNNPASLSYIKRKKNNASKANIKTRLFQIDANSDPNELEKGLKALI